MHLRKGKRLSSAICFMKPWRQPDEAETIKKRTHSTPLQQTIFEITLATEKHGHNEELPLLQNIFHLFSLRYFPMNLHIFLLIVCC